MRYMIFCAIAMIVFATFGCHKDMSQNPQEVTNAYLGQYYRIHMKYNPCYIDTIYIWMVVSETCVSLDYNTPDNPEGCQARVTYVRYPPDTINFLSKGSEYSVGCNRALDLTGRFKYWRVCDSLNLDGLDTTGGINHKFRLKGFH